MRWSGKHLRTWGSTLFAASLCGPVPGASTAQSTRGRVWPELEAGPYAVGYTVRHEYDYSRTFRQKVDYFGERTAGEIARPVQITIWYPASAAARGRPMRVSEYYDALATETEFAARTADDLRALAEGYEGLLMMEWRVPPESVAGVASQLDSIFGQSALAMRDAPTAAGPFPLILHMPGYNGSASHHYPLFEYLASHGFVVAAVPSMGLHSREIDDERLSLDVQARDLEFAYSVLRTLPFVDADRVGTTGMSWGGMSNVLFASRNAYVDAVATLDGAITMPAELELIESVPGYSHRSIGADYLQLLVSPEEAQFRPKDLRFWNALRYSTAYSVQFNGVRHDDFSPGNRRLQNVVETDTARVAYLETFTRAELEYVLRFFQAALRGDTVARSSLAVLSERMGLPDSMVARTESKRALRAPPSVVEFAAILRTRGAEAARQVYREVRENEAELELVTSPVMGPVFMDAMNAGRLAEALAVCELWAEAMPDAPGPLFSMGRAYRAMGDTANAIATYERILRMVPEGPQAETARRALADLRGRRRAASITAASTHQTSPSREKNRNRPSGDRVGLLSTRSVLTPGPRFAGSDHDPSGRWNAT